jgi:hypothetical protein
MGAANDPSALPHLPEVPQLATACTPPTVPDVLCASAPCKPVAAFTVREGSRMSATVLQFIPRNGSTRALTPGPSRNPKQNLRKTGISDMTNVSAPCTHHPEARLWRVDHPFNEGPWKCDKCAPPTPGLDVEYHDPSAPSDVKHGTRNKVQGTRPRTTLGVGSGANSLALVSGGHGQADLYRLLDAYRAKTIAPVSVALGELPEHADADAQRFVERLRLLFGLRHADGEYRELPVSLRFGCRLMDWPEDQTHRTRISRLLARLVRWRVIVAGPDLPRRQGTAYGTKTYGLPRAAERSLRVVREEAA